MQALEGTNTTDGLDGGSNGCLYSVNKVLKPAGVVPPWGDSVYVLDAHIAFANALIPEVVLFLHHT